MGPRRPQNPLWRASLAACLAAWLAPPGHACPRATTGLGYVGGSWPQCAVFLLIPVDTCRCLYQKLVAFLLMLVDTCYILGRVSLIPSRMSRVSASINKNTTRVWYKHPQVSTSINKNTAHWGHELPTYSNPVVAPGHSCPGGANQAARQAAKYSPQVCAPQCPAGSSKVRTFLPACRRRRGNLRL